MGGPRATFGDERRCNRCRETKPLTEFYKGQYRCKACGKPSQSERARNKGVPEKRKRNPWLIEQGYKECFRCDGVKPLSEFSPASRGFGGVAAYCKPCTSQYNLDRRALDPGFKEKLSEYRSGEVWKTQHRANQMKRRITKTKQDTGSVTVRILRGIYATETCYYCNQTIPFENRTVDHKTPLSRGGLHDPTNLVMACGSCNSSKGSLTEKEFRERGILSKNPCG